MHAFSVWRQNTPWGRTQAPVTLSPDAARTDNAPPCLAPVILDVQTAAMQPGLTGAPETPQPGPHKLQTSATLCSMQGMMVWQGPGHLRGPAWRRARSSLSNMPRSAAMMTANSGRSRGSCPHAHVIIHSKQCTGYQESSSSCWVRGSEASCATSCGLGETTRGCDM